MNAVLTSRGIARGADPRGMGRRQAPGLCVKAGRAAALQNGRARARNRDAHPARENGFTLIELLTVVAIGMILAALLLPACAALRARARQSTCLGNLSQVARAGLLYLQDYDERFPSCYTLPTPPYAIDPATTLQPYLRNRAVLYCPERRTVMPGCLDPAANFRSNSRCMGYGYNWGSGLGWSETLKKGDGLVRWNGVAGVGVLLAEVASPAGCLFYGDTNDYGFLTLLRDAMPGVAGSGANNARANLLGMRYEPPRHSAGNNFAFVDGHVRWLAFPGGRWTDGGPWVVPEMSMYSRTGRWETGPVP